MSSLSRTQAERAAYIWCIILHGGRQEQQELEKFELPFKIQLRAAIMSLLQSQAHSQAQI
jgi:hypothetical protein